MAVGSTVAGALLKLCKGVLGSGENGVKGAGRGGPPLQSLIIIGRPGENVAKEGTILPLPYIPLYFLVYLDNRKHLTQDVRIFETPVHHLH